GYRRLHSRFVVQAAEPEPEHEGETLVRWVGFLLMFAGSVGLEFLRMRWLQVSLPRTPGGVIGQLIGHAANEALGFTGATLLLLLLFGLGFSWYFQVSWLALAERIGETVELTFDWFRLRLEDREDRRYGEVAATKRDEVVVNERAKYVEKHAAAPALKHEPQFEDAAGDEAPAAA